jgi:hypothetical protein
MGIFAFLLLKIVGKVVKVVFAVMFILLLIFAAFTFLSYRDYVSIKDQFHESSNLFVFQNNGTITYAAKSTGFSLVNAAVLPKATKIDLQRQLDSADYEAMQKGYYKLLLINESMYNQTYMGISKDFADNTLKPVSLAVHDGKAMIYPETPFFNMIKHVPRFVLSIGLSVFG